MTVIEVLAQGTLDLDAQLAHAEAKIERATRNAFYEVGLELRNIRDSRLYRQQYGTFEGYCLERWDQTPQRVNQLIASASVVEQMENKFSILPSRERHADALLRLPDTALRGEVWQRVIVVSQEDKTRVTTKVVEAEVERKLAELSREWFTVEEWERLSPADRHRVIVQPYANPATFNETNDNIEWAAYSWNPVTGCRHECPYCYARDIAHRFFAQGFEPAFLPNRLSAPRNTKPGSPRWEGDTGRQSVFVCSMADLFGAWVPREWIDAVLDVVRAAPQWNFIFLTKNPKRLASVDWPSNAWVGATVDQQARVKPAEDAFRNVNATVRFLSCEPMEENLTFDSLEIFDWLIMGGRSKSTQQPEAQPEWAWVKHLLLQWWETHPEGPEPYMKANLTIRARGYPKR